MSPRAVRLPGRPDSRCADVSTKPPVIVMVIGSPITAGSGCRESAASRDPIAVVVPLGVAHAAYVAAVIGYYAHPPASYVIPPGVSDDYPVPCRSC
jgi:hypothetical protein